MCLYIIIIHARMRITVRISWWLHTRYSGSGDYKSSLYTSSSAEQEQYIAAGVIIACDC